MRLRIVTSLPPPLLLSGLILFLVLAITAAAARLATTGIATLLGVRPGAILPAALLAFAVEAVAMVVVWALTASVLSGTPCCRKHFKKRSCSHGVQWWVGGCVGMIVRLWSIHLYVVMVSCVVQWHPCCLVTPLALLS